MQAGRSARSVVFPTRAWGFDADQLLRDWGNRSFSPQAWGLDSLCTVKDINKLSFPHGRGDWPELSLTRYRFTGVFPTGAGIDLWISVNN